MILMAMDGRITSISRWRMARELSDILFTAPAKSSASSLVISLCLCGAIARGQVLRARWFPLQELQSSNETFSLSRDAFVELCGKVGLTEDQAILAISLFHDWGVIHQLPVSAGGDIVLRPQSLSDVLSCVVHAHHPQPVLHHEALRDIWLQFDQRLHRQFLALMHECNLAYPLFSSDGTPLDKSLVPALMSDDYELLSSPDSAMHSRFFPDIRSDLIYPTIRISYKNTPDRFFPMLHCRLHHMVALDGMWKHCVFLSRCVGESSSYAVLREVPVVISTIGAASSYMEILSAGTDMSCAAEVMRVMRSLRDESFRGMELDEVSIWCDGVPLATKAYILEELEDGCLFLEYRRGGVSSMRRRKAEKNAPMLIMPLQPLEILFPERDVTSVQREDDDMLASEEEESKEDSLNMISLALDDQYNANQASSHIDDAGVKSAENTFEEYELSARLYMLQQYCSQFVNHSELVKSVCRATLVRHLVMCATEFLSEMRADYRLSALWAMASSESESVHYLMALSSVGHGSGLSVERESLIRIQYQPLSSTNTSARNAAVSELLVSCLEALDVKLPIIGGQQLKWRGVCSENVSAYSNEMLRIEESFFEKEYVGNNTYMSYSKHHLMQQRGMRNIADVMQGMRDIMMRVDATTQRLEGQVASVDLRLQEVLRVSQSQVNMLRSLLKGEVNMPQLLFALKDDKWHMDSMVYAHLRLFCVCPVTLRVASCGSDGKGWKLKVLRSEVAKILPILKVGVVLLQVAAKLGLGLNVKIPLPSLKNCRALSDLVKQSSLTINSLDVTESVDDMLSAIERGGDAALPVEALSEMMRDYSSIYRLLDKARVIDTSTGRPKKAGLQFATSSCDGTTAFVHADGLQRFHAKGEAAFLTPIA